MVLKCIDYELFLWNKNIEQLKQREMSSLAAGWAFSKILTLFNTLFTPKNSAHHHASKVPPTTTFNAGSPPPNFYPFLKTVFKITYSSWKFKKILSPHILTLFPKIGFKHIQQILKKKKKKNTPTNFKKKVSKTAQSILNKYPLLLTLPIPFWPFSDPTKPIFEQT